MLRAFSTSATGMAAQQTMVDTIANNLANINTNGFKKTQVNFEDLLYYKMQAAGREATNGVVAPGSVEIGSGVRQASTTRVFTPGEISSTERALDVAIQGDGFLMVSKPDGDTAYTRDGSLMRDANGVLVTSNGYVLEPQITIPSDATNINIAVDGTVTAITPSGTSSIGQIQLAKFVNPEGLSSEGGNLYLETDASGAPTISNPGEGGTGQLLGGHLEKSNVQMVTELVNLITAQRAYEVNSKAIKTGDAMLQTANQLVR